MKVTALVENTTKNSKIKAKHGVSLYIETLQHSVLFDVGSNGLFLENAQKLGIDISSVDRLIISHGHFDHGGALDLFLKSNKIAKIYIHKNAFNPHYIKVAGIKINIGLNQKLKDNPRVTLTDNMFVLDDELTLFSDTNYHEYRAESNKKLYAKEFGKIIQDNFSHEQCLVITENGNSTLFAGCSHKGIWNYVKEAERFCNSLLACVGGFHLYNPPTRKYEKDKLLDELAIALKETGLKYFTCHCTGQYAFKRMKKIIGENLSYLSCGESIEI